MSGSVSHQREGPGSLRALFLNCSLKGFAEISNTESLCILLIERLRSREPGIEIEMIRVADYNIKPGVRNDEGGGDQWPGILEKIKRCNIIVFATPVWMGVRSSVAQRVIERLSGTTKAAVCDESGQYPLYGAVCGCVATGHEGGSHDCIASTFANLLQFGATAPPNTDLYWFGGAGQESSYIESRGWLSPQVQRNAELAAANLLFAARLLRENAYQIDLAKEDKLMVEQSRAEMGAVEQVDQ